MLLFFAKAPKCERFRAALTEAEGEGNVFIFGGYVRDILSGDTLRLSAGHGDTFFAPLSDKSGTAEDRANRLAAHPGGDVDIYLHRSIDYDGDGKMCFANVVHGDTLRPSRKHDKIKVCESTLLSAGVTSRYVGSTETLGDVHSEHAKNLLKRQHGHCEHVILSVNKADVAVATNANADVSAPAAGAKLTVEHKHDSEEVEDEFLVRADVFFMSNASTETYMEYELAMCDFDVNRLVEHRDMLHLRAFVRADCPYAEEEKEHARLLRAFRTRTFSFAYRANPSRGNPPDARLLFRWLRMIVTKGWTLDLTNPDNVRCIGSLWLGLFNSTFGANNNQLEGEFLQTFDWAAFFPKHRGLIPPNTSKLTRYWTPETGKVLAQWLVSAMHDSTPLHLLRVSRSIVISQWPHFLPCRGSSGSNLQRCATLPSCGMRLCASRHTSSMHQSCPLPPVQSLPRRGG
jgi:hypothetical protein